MKTKNVGFTPTHLIDYLRDSRNSRPRTGREATRFYTDDEIVERAEQMGREAARKKCEKPGELEVPVSIGDEKGRNRYNACSSLLATIKTTSVMAASIGVIRVLD